MKKLWCVLLSAALCLGAAGCADEGVNTEGWVNESGEEPITLTWFVDVDTFNKEFGDNLTDREIFCKTGVRIEFSNSDSVTGSSKLNTMIMKNSLTDLVSTPAEGGSHVQMIKGNRIWDMKSLFAEYPEVEDFVPADMYKWCSYPDDGKLYGIRSHFFGDDCESGELLANMVLVASGNLMEEYGLDPQEDFSSMDKLISSLEKVKEGEQKKGTKGFIPFYTASGGEELNEFLAIPRETPDGDYLDWRDTKEAKELAVDLNYMYRKRLISNLSFTESLKLKDAIMQERVFLVLMNFANSQYELWDAYNDLGDQYVAVGPLRNDDGDDPLLTCWTPNGYLATCISKNCRYPERALKLLEFLYSDEGQVLSNFGIEGESYYIDETDGKYYYTNEYYAMEDYEAAEVYGFNWYEVLTSRTPYWRSLMGLPKINPARFTQEIHAYFSQYAYNTRVWNSIHPTDTTTGLPNVMNTANAKFVWTQIITAADASKGDAEARELVLAKYNEQLAARNNVQIGTVSYTDVTDFYTARFKEHKETLGEELAWPGYKN